MNILLMKVIFILICKPFNKKYETFWQHIRLIIIEYDQFIVNDNFLKRDTFFKTVVYN